MGHTRHFLGAIALGLIPWATADAQNAYLQSPSIGRYIKTGINYEVKARVRNTTSVPITQFRMGWRWNNGAVNLGPVQPVGGGGIVTNNFLNYTHPVQLNVPTQGAGTLKIWVQVTGDTDQTNDTLTLTVRPLSSWVAKNVLLEAKTATWCQYCPPANVVGNTIDANPNVVVAKFHANDGFSTASATAYLNANMNVTFTPAGMIDQGEYGSYTVNSTHTAWDAEVTDRLNAVAPVSVQVAPTYNASTRQLTLPVTTTFTYAEAGTYTINAYILEDDVTGPQTNGGAGSNYVHKQIVRHVLGGNGGTTGAIPASPAANTPYTHTYTHTLPTDWNASKVRVMAYVTHREGGTALTLNATKASMLPVSVEELAGLRASLSVFPNPFHGWLQVDLAADPAPAELMLFQPDGRLVRSWNKVFNGDPVVLDGLDELPAGAYLLRLARNGAATSIAVVKD